MSSRRTFTTLALALAALAPAARAQGTPSLNLICSVQDEWCSLMSATFSRTSGIKVNVLKRSTGEALAQLIAKDATRVDLSPFDPARLRPLDPSLLQAR